MREKSKSRYTCKSCGIEIRQQNVEDFKSLCADCWNLDEKGELNSETLLKLQERRHSQKAMVVMRESIRKEKKEIKKAKKEISHSETDLQQFSKRSLIFGIIGLLISMVLIIYDTVIIPKWPILNGFFVVIFVGLGFGIEAIVSGSKNTQNENKWSKIANSGKQFGWISIIIIISSIVLWVVIFFDGEWFFG